MIKTNKVIFFLFFFFLFFSCSQAVEPTKDQIDKVVDKMKQEEIDKTKFNQFIAKFFIKILEKLKYGKNLINLALLFLLSTFLFILFFFLIRFFTQKRYSYHKDSELKKEFKRFVFDKEYLEKLINDTQYSEAILYLHKCTIFYLMQKEIVFKKNMTNFDYYLKVKDKKFAVPFKTIYSFSEKILFDNYSAKKDDLVVCKNLYDEYFLIFDS
ncbi:MAG: hypothetical protein A2086_11485 [Spirochaetes bacterium GWD1_27_9]|nr:MAG: hypothetical protein A2Y34_14265 [Spirochaetes bacterium GWC1_27_15]OHD36550.1 MAG: hypothetical protein A2086_11485 [Spirochaetes bacterium GWD1_27_9]